MKLNKLTIGVVSIIMLTGSAFGTGDNGKGNKFFKKSNVHHVWKHKGKPFHLSDSILDL